MSSGAGSTGCGRRVACLIPGTSGQPCPIYLPSCAVRCGSSLPSWKRIETVVSASARKGQNTEQVRQRADDLTRMGGYCYYLRQHERALTHLNKAIGLAAGDPDAMIGRALVSCALGQHQSAIQDLERALKLNEDPRGYLYRGLCESSLARTSGPWRTMAGPSASSRLWSRLTTAVACSTPGRATMAKRSRIRTRPGA